MKRRDYARAMGVAIGVVSLAGCATEPEEDAETTEESDGSGPTDGTTTSETATAPAGTTTTGTTSSPDGDSTTGDGTQTSGSGGGGGGGGGASTPTTSDDSTTDEIRSTTVGTPVRGTTETPPETSDS